jgi:phosphohistidine phosphatase
MLEGGSARRSPQMHRRLIVLRHAKSDWNTNAGSDHERPLNGRGQRDAPRIGEHLQQRGWVPAAVISSDATRTRETWQRMKQALGGEPEVSFTRSLYLAGPPEVRAALAMLDDAVSTAMVIGHNPGWEDVVSALCEVRVRITTCNAALLVIQAPTWADAASRRDWGFEAMLRPKEL